jgi:Zn-dependent peptidase ImmA (M78 family)
MASSRSIEMLESIVVQFRARLGMKDVEYIELESVLEKMVHLFPGFSYRCVPDNMLHGAKGMYSSETEVMEIPSNVFLGMKNRIPHFRFSVAHEIAHVILKHEGVRFRHAERKAYEKANPSIWRDEREAEQFAALLLAPTHLAEQCKTATELQKKFGLSSDASEIRIKEIEAHNRRKNNEIRPLTPKVIDFLRYAEGKGYRVLKKVDLPPILPREAPQPMAGGSQSAPNLTQSIKSENEVCSGCGSLTLERIGLRLVCYHCGMRLPL